MLSLSLSLENKNGGIGTEGGGGNRNLAFIILSTYQNDHFSHLEF